MAEGFSRLPKPMWPRPDSGNGAHLRGIGQIKRRRKIGFEGWVGEDHLALGVNALSVQLPRLAKTGPIGRIRLVRKACFFDGLINGRFEFLFSVDPKPCNRATALQAAHYLLALKTTINKFGFEGSLATSSDAAGRLWANATVKHGQDAHPEWVKAGRPVCVVECDTSLRDEKSSPPTALSGPIVDLTFTTKPMRGEIFLIHNPLGELKPIGRGSTFRPASRYVRTYIFRLLQNVESLSLLFSLPLSIIDEDRIQSLLNEYLRQVNRSRNNLEHYDTGQLIEYCYSAFNRLYPGRIESLRSQIQNSQIRPNVVRKVLQFLDISEASKLNVDKINFGDEIQGDKVMNDKYENIKLSGQGIAVGQSATAIVKDSSNVSSTTVKLIATSLSDLAQIVRNQSHRDDAEAEASILEAAAKLVEKGDESSAAALLKKSASWVLDLAKSTGSGVLAAFLGSYLGIGG